MFCRVGIQNVYCVIVRNNIITIYDVVQPSLKNPSNFLWYAPIEAELNNIIIFYDVRNNIIISCTFPYTREPNRYRRSNKNGTKLQKYSKKLTLHALSIRLNVYNLCVCVCVSHTYKRVQAQKYNVSSQISQTCVCKREWKLFRVCPYTRRRGHASYDECICRERILAAAATNTALACTNCHPATHAHTPLAPTVMCYRVVYYKRAQTFMVGQTVNNRLCSAFSLPCHSPL